MPLIAKLRYQGINIFFNVKNQDVYNILSETMRSLVCVYAVQHVCGWVRLTICIRALWWPHVGLPPVDLTTLSNSSLHSYSVLVGYSTQIKCTWGQKELTEACSGRSKGGMRPSRQISEYDPEHKKSCEREV